MNYGLIPASVCETLYRESEIRRKTAVGSSFLPFFLFSCVIPWAFILRVTTLI